MYICYHSWPKIWNNLWCFDSNVGWPTFPLDAWTIFWILKWKQEKRNTLPSFTLCHSPKIATVNIAGLVKVKIFLASIQTINYNLASPPSPGVNCTFYVTFNLKSDDDNNNNKNKYWKFISEVIKYSTYEMKSESK